MAQTTSLAIEQMSAQLYGELAQSTLKHWLKDYKVANNINEKIQSWALQAKTNLDQQHPYLEAQRQLEHWTLSTQLSDEDFQCMLQQYQEFNSLIGHPDLTDILHKRIINREGTASTQPFFSNQHMQFQLLRDKWQRKLTEAITHWEFEQLALQRDAFLEEMKDFLATLQKMSKHKDRLGLDTGIFIDYSKGQLSTQDVERFEEWCRYLEQDTELLKLCNMIGTAQPSKNRSSQFPIDLTQQSDACLEDHLVPEEITGIHFAQELSLALPSELALLSDPDFEILFDLKFLESNLMSFNVQGQQNGRVLDDQYKAQHRLGQKGPMVLCLDTSGSMHGQSELIAKAIVLYLSMHAMKSKRALYLINFSTNLTALNLSQKHSLDDLIHFLSQSFHGGTDIIPAIEHAISMIKTPYFHHADVVVISDFIMGQLTEDLVKSIDNHKQQGHGFYAVAIGNLRLDHLQAGLFDHQWVYQSQTGEIVKL